VWGFGDLGDSLDGRGSVVEPGRVQDISKMNELKNLAAGVSLRGGRVDVGTARHTVGL
jgi:hypothetical protein